MCKCVAIMAFLFSSSIMLLFLLTYYIQALLRRCNTITMYLIWSNSVLQFWIAQWFMRDSWQIYLLYSQKFSFLWAERMWLFKTLLYWFILTFSTYVIHMHAWNLTAATNSSDSETYFFLKKSTNESLECKIQWLNMLHVEILLKSILN